MKKVRQRLLVLVLSPAMVVQGLALAANAQTWNARGTTPTAPSRTAQPQTQPRGAGAAPSYLGSRPTNDPARPLMPAAQPNPAASRMPAAAPAANPLNRSVFAPQQQPAAAAPAQPAAQPKTSAAAPAADPAQANAPSAEQALQLAPVLGDVDYAMPAADEIAQCRVTAKRLEGGIGWIVEDGAGQVLRKFLDSNGDNKVDQWCYYKDGLEVYRDIDSNHNGKADQYRWFHTGGSRWALDRDEDGSVDAWQSISAEEVTAEVVAAIAQQDAARFQRLLLSAEELRSLGLGETRSQELAEKVGGAAAKFAALVRQQKDIQQNTRWVHFSGNRPGIVPAGTDGSSKDLHVYENVMAFMQTEGNHGQLQIGTLVKVGDAWRLIDAPQSAGEGQAELAATGFFFRIAQPNRPADAPAAGGISEETQKILAELEKLDNDAHQAATVEEQSRIHAKRADLLEKMAADATKPEDRKMWLRQLIDSTGAAVQAGAYPQGLDRLAKLAESLLKNEQDKQIAAHIEFVLITADYAVSVQAKGADFSKVQAEWLKRLEQFVATYPKCPEAAEAMLQLGIAQEFAGDEEKARKWYAQAAADYPDLTAAKKAAGAKARLESVGKEISLRGNGPAGAVDLAKYRGRIVLIQYWATWCEPCKADMAVLKDLLEKYNRSGFSVIGVNLDSSTEEMTAFLKENPLPWPQIYEEGGLESRPAVELGILTLPTMILVDQDGKVLNRSITTGELSSELRKLAK